jgi:hypothetical protein
MELAVVARLDLAGVLLVFTISHCWLSSRQEVALPRHLVGVPMVPRF